jgi:GNAT superfamily N-acetyltransferase
MAPSDVSVAPCSTASAGAAAHATVGAGEAPAIERLARADVDAGLRLSDAARWNQTDDDWAFFIEHGDAFGLRDGAGALVATAAALPYGARAGWVSMVLVDAAHRHRGLATRLLGACVDALRAHGRVPVLDATPDGAAVYRRAGFVAGFAFERWEGDAGGAAAPVGDAVVDVRDERQRDALRALDRSLWDLEREALLSDFLARPATRAFLAADASGFALVRAGRRAWQLGPIVAADADSAAALLARALGAAHGRVFVDVPVDAGATAAELARRGFVRQRPFVRMALGTTTALAANARVHAVAGPEFG